MDSSIGYVGDIMKQHKPIFIISNWKAGSTLLQFFLHKAENIDNIFRGEDYDGTHFWAKYGAMTRNDPFGDHFPKETWKFVPKDKLMENLNDKHDPKKGTMLLKRPQFSVNIDFVKWLFDDNVEFIGLTRDITANTYSYYRNQFEFNKMNHGVFVGLRPPGWKDIVRRRDILEYGVWTCRYVEEMFKKHEIPTITYEELTDDTENTLGKIEDIIGYNIKLDEIPKMNNLNKAYKEGCQVKSINYTTRHGKLDQDNTKMAQVKPFTEKQLAKIEEYIEKYKDVQII